MFSLLGLSFTVMLLVSLHFCVKPDILSAFARSRMLSRREVVFI